VPGTMNFFFEHTTEEFVAKVDNDTIVPKGWLGKLLAAVTEHNLDVVGAKHYFNVSRYKDWNDLVAHGERKGELVLHPWVGGSGIIIRRSFVAEPLPTNMGKMFGWTHYQDAKGKPGKIAFHEGVEVGLLDMETDNKFNNDFPDYNREIQGSRMRHHEARIKVLYMLVGCDGVDWYRAQQVGRGLEACNMGEVAFANMANDREELIGNKMDWADVIVWRWPSLDLMELRMKMAEFIGHKTHIIDFEDNFFKVNPFNTAYKHFGTEDVAIMLGGEPRQLWANGHDGFDIEANSQSRRQLWKNMSNAADITVCSEGLSEVYQKRGIKRGWVIPDTIDVANFPRIKFAPRDGIRIGWWGGASHYEDVAKITPILREIMSKYPQVTYVNYGQWFEGPMQMLPHDRVERHGWEHIRAHGYKLATLDLDVSVIPLVEDEFASGKSSLKWKESSALGVPCVAQRFGPYGKDLVDGSTGLLASTPEEWIAALSRLIEDAELRKSIGGAAYEEVVSNHNMKDWGLKTWQIYREIMEKQGSKPSEKLQAVLA
jgi:glycosyltransferase involved in cell wall biosynthesis